MKAHVVISAFLCLMSFNSAEASDPFSIIFGDESVQTSVTNNASRDNLNIIRLKIRHHLVSDSFVSYELKNGLCVPFLPFLEALELPFNYNGHKYIGSISNNDEIIDITPEKHSGFVKTETNWCVLFETIEAILPLNIEYRPSNLELLVTPKVSLPIDDRLSREELRSSFKRKHSASLAEYRPVSNSYQFFRFPTIDTSIDFSLSSENRFLGRANFTGATDLLWMNAHFQSSSNLEKHFENNRLKLFRHNYWPEELAFLKARRFAIGDIASFSQPFISNSQPGRGAIISNRPLYEPDLFDEEILRGPLLEGWEAELYGDDQLLGFITEPDANGEYIFERVALGPGYNHFTVKLFGPYGETSERHITKFVGPEHCPENEWRYSFGFIDSSTSFFGESLIDKGVNTTQSVDNLFSTFLSLENGLSKDLTVRADVNYSEERSIFSGSLVSSILGGYAVGRLAADSHGNSGWQVNFQKRLSPKTSFTTKYSDFGKLKSNINGYEDNRITRQFSGRFNTLLRLNDFVFPIQSEMNYNHRENDLSELYANIRLTGNYKRLKWNKSFKLNQTSEKGRSEQSAYGEILASYNLPDIKLRGAINYEYSNKFSVNSLALSGRTKFAKNSQVQIGLTYNMRDDVTSFDATLTKSFNKISLQSKAKIDSSGEWQIGAGLSFALYYDKRRNKYRSARPGLSRTGAIAPRIFDDLNGNSVFDDEDQSIFAAQFIVENSLRSEQSDEFGINLISDLTSAKPLNAEIKVSSISDLYLRPVEIGRTMEVRAGQVLQYDVPLMATGEIEGTLNLKKGDSNIPISGLTIQALNEVGNVVGNTKTEYDGYFYLENIPATEITLRVSDEDLKLISGSFEPAKVYLSRDKPSEIGVFLTINQSKF